MANMKYFPQRPEVKPMIYAYSDLQYPGCLKVGYTAVDIDESIMMMFFNMIEKYTVMHIKILAYYQNPKKFIDTDCTNIIMGSAKDYLYQVYPQFKTSDSIVDKIINELYNDGLLGSNSTSLNTGMTMNGMLASRTKELGNSFIAFISNE